MENIKTYKDQSRVNWYHKEYQQSVKLEQIQIGCLQRIADATELMAKNYIELQNRLKRAEEGKKHYFDLYMKMERKNAALRGVITKLKKKDR